MAKLYTLDDKLLTEVPEVRVGDKVYPVDNRQKTVMAIQRAMEQTDADPAAQMSAALRLALGEQAERELAARDLPYPAVQALFALVLAAPVLGHAKRGKAIAVSFGVLLGLLPFSGMVLFLIVPFLFFSLILKVNPHAWRVIFSFGCFVAAAHIWVPVPALRFGAWLIGAAVTAKHAIYVKCAHERLRLEWGLKPRRSSRAADD